MSQHSSKIFSGYRAVGINSNHVPCVIRYNKKHQETYAITSVGKAFHVYKVGIFENFEILYCYGSMTSFHFQVLQPRFDQSERHAGR